MRRLRSNISFHRFFVLEFMVLGDGTSFHEGGIWLYCSRYECILYLNIFSLAGRERDEWLSCINTQDRNESGMNEWMNYACCVFFRTGDFQTKPHAVHRSFRPNQSSRGSTASYGIEGKRKWRSGSHILTTPSFQFGFSKRERKRKKCFVQ